LPARAAVSEPGKVCDSLVRIAVYASAPAPPVPPVAPFETRATVMVSDTPAASDILIVMVRCVIVEPVMVTVLPERTAYAGNAPKVPPSRLACHCVIVVLSAVPVTTDVAGVVAPPVEGCVNT